VRGVILAAAVFLWVFLPAQIGMAQISRAPKVDKGPRAVALMVLPPTGKPRIIPIAIMVDGEFYDASAYKASPVPMALWADTVYDAQKTGISQGLFTVTGALQNTETKAWVAEGRFETAASLAARAAKKPAPVQPRGLNDDSGPPVLLRRSNKPAPADATSVPSTTSPGSSTPPAAPGSTAGSSAPPAPSTPATAPAQQSAASTPTPAPDDSAAPPDPNRPALKRGKQPPRAEKPDNSTVTAATTAKPGAPSSRAATPPAGEPQLIPAISDVGGPEPRSYAFVLKTGEEQEFQKKMLALAADDVHAREKQLAGEAVGTLSPLAHHTAPKGKPAKTPLPNFADIQLRVFDLTNSNDAVIVLTARAREPQPIVSGEDTVPPKDFFVSEVAREDLNGDLHKVSSNVTDTQHLDVSPRWELIDAVDANGDGAGELLFQKFSDSGTTFAIYRVIGDQLYPIFEGTRGE
jgi:hypothetical protein